MKYPQHQTRRGLWPYIAFASSRSFVLGGAVFVVACTSMPQTGQDQTAVSESRGAADKLLNVHLGNDRKVVKFYSTIDPYFNLGDKARCGALSLLVRDSF